MTFKEKLQRALHHSTASTSPTTSSPLSTSPTSILTTSSSGYSTAPSTSSPSSSSGPNLDDSPRTPTTIHITTSAPPPTPMHPKSPLSKTLSFHRFRSNIEGGRRMPWSSSGGAEDKADDGESKGKDVASGIGGNVAGAGGASKDKPQSPAEMKAQVRREHQQLLSGFEWGGGKGAHGNGPHGDGHDTDGTWRKPSHGAVSPRTGSVVTAAAATDGR